MNLNTQKFGLAAGFTGAIAYTICALFVWGMPLQTMYMFKAMTHMMNINPQVSVLFSSFIVGLIVVFVYAYVVGYVFSAIYNKLLK